ncbi:MAG: 4-methylaminobutanoate oxidase (formaldehyde-forming) [candidate division WS2 bacterium]|nr:4-methylaminobutanoate oxidase (formaldehyde-forming) [Candidatus Lithacetigena glycinireducens]
MKETADIIIVGGGCQGVSLAYHLAKKKAGKIILLEKFYLGSGATGACAAGIRAQWGLPINCKLAIKSIEKFERMDEELGFPGGIDLKQGGYLVLAYQEEEVAQLKKNVQLQNSLGISSRVITSGETKNLVPHLNTQGVIGATYHHRDGYANPHKVTFAYGEASARLGVEIRKFTPVNRLIVDGGKVLGVETDKEIIYAPIVVITAGIYSTQLLSPIGINIPLYGERHEALVTEPLEPMVKPMIISFSLNLYCQQTPHGSFIMGCGDPNKPVGEDISSTPQFLFTMTKKITHLLPFMKKVRVVRQWGGSYDMTPDATPIIGAVSEIKGLYLSTGFSGHGFMLSPMSGELLSQLIIGETPSVDISGLNLERFQRGELIREPSVVG